MKKTYLTPAVIITGYTDIHLVTCDLSDLPLHLIQPITKQAAVLNQRLPQLPCFLDSVNAETVKK